MSERLCERVLNLPVYLELEAEELSAVVEQVEGSFAGTNVPRGRL